MSARRAMIIATALFLFASAALADDKFANCPDPEAARKFVKACLQESPYNSSETCVARALDQLCGNK